MPNKILILEDDPERVYWFYQEFFEDVLFITNNAEVACQILQDTKFNLIYLDHDLGGKTFVDSANPNTGWQVTKMIPETLNNGTNVVIHSWNTGAAKRMGKYLQKNEKYDGKITIAPFGTWNAK